MRAVYRRERKTGRRGMLVAALLSLAALGSIGLYALAGRADMRAQAVSLVAKAETFARENWTRLSNAVQPEEAGARRTSGAYPVRLGFLSGPETGKKDGSGANDNAADPASSLEREFAVVPEDPGDPSQAVDKDSDSAMRAEPAKHRAASFADAFRDLGAPEKTPDKRKAGADGLLSVTFDLDKANAAANAIEVRKAVRADGVNKGKVALRIVNDTTIMVDPRQLAGVVGEGAHKDRLSALAASSRPGSFIDFDTLRTAGFDVRYDPVLDIVVVSSKKS